MSNGVQEARKVLAEARAKANGAAFLNEKQDASRQMLQVIHALASGVGYDAELGRGGEILTIVSPWRTDEWLTLRASDAGVQLELGDSNGPSKKPVESPAMTYDAAKKTWGATKGDETLVLTFANVIARAFEPGDVGKQPHGAPTRREAPTRTASPNGEREPRTEAQNGR